MMYNDLKNSNVIVEIEALVNSANEENDDISSYVQFMKERIMSVSGIN